MKNPFTQRLKLNFNRINLTFLFIYVLTAVISCDKPEGSYSYPDILKNFENTVWKWEYTKISTDSSIDYLLPDTNEIYHIKFKGKKVIYYHNYRKVASFYIPYPQELREPPNTVLFQNIGTITFYYSGELECLFFPIKKTADNSLTTPLSRNFFSLTNEKL